MTEDKQTCSRCIIPDTYPDISFDAEGVCSVCRAHEQRWEGWEEGLAEKRQILERLCEDARVLSLPFQMLARFTIA